MPMSGELCDRLGLAPMVAKNTDNHETAFTVSIDHVETTTGISAFERSHTALAALRPDARPEDFRRPGHMFPLRAKAGGVLVRNGHTEATVDLCRLAGLAPCGLCCEIMADDGTMMRTPELIEFARRHDMTFITIADSRPGSAPAPKFWTRTTHRVYSRLHDGPPFSTKRRAELHQDASKTPPSRTRRRLCAYTLKFDAAIDERPFPRLKLRRKTS